MIACPTEQTWRHWLDESLPESARSDCESHLPDCSNCQSTLDRLTARPAWSWLGQSEIVKPAARIAAPAPAIPGLTIIDEVGRGGHGVVYRAQQEGLGRTVAVKLLKHGLAASADERSRLEVEAASLARLRHPNIVQVHSTGDHDGMPYLVMEWVDGGNLATQLDGVPWPPKRAAALVETLARAVAAAHEAGIIHRDLKPGNVLLTADRTPRIADFGLAKFLDVPQERTPTIAILGTPSYMAPEQAEGSSNKVGPEADVFALGAILYELLTGRPPFLAATPFETLLQVRESDPVAPRVLQPKLPRDFETICLHCLHKNPARRYATALELAEELQRVQAGQPIRARPVGFGERVWKWGVRNPSKIAALGVGVAAIAVVALIWSLLSQRAAEARANAIVDGLLAADPDEAPGVLRELQPVQRRVLPYLAARAAEAPANSRVELNAAIGLLANDADAQLPVLLRRLNSATPAETALISRSLQPYAATVTPQLWDAALNQDGVATERLRAASALAVLAPGDDRWKRLAPFTAGWLASENTLLVGPWARILRPARGHLIDPLSALAVDPERSEAERIAACSVVADFASEDPARLAALWLDVEPRSAVVLLPSLKRNWPSVRQVFAVASATTVSDGSSDDTKDRAAKRRMRASIGLLHAGEPATVNTFLAESGVDVRTRYYVIHNLAALGVDPDFIIGHIRNSANAVVRRSALSALGEYDAAQLGRRIEDLRPVLERLFRDDPDPGVHSAIEWLVGQAWKREPWLRAADVGIRRNQTDGKRWIVTPGGTTMAIVEGPIAFTMGSHPTESHEPNFEPRTRHLIRHRYAIATREVTVAEFDEFLKAHPEVKYRSPRPDDRKPVHAVRRVRWHEALMYCRWLSEKEGIPDDQISCPSFAELQKEVPQFPSRFLDRTGYRLPTEAEWEYACRAGTDTPRFYGSDRDLVYRYAWLIVNSNDICHAGGMLRPNDLGLFDIYGNVWEWTQTAKSVPTDGPNNEMTDDRSDQPWRPESGDHRMFTVIARGGSYLYHEPFVRSARRYNSGTDGDTTIGFRIARTMPASKR